jgi:hypothetical protein
MALPKQQAPIYTLDIPSTKESLKYRPFLVKEQKALLLAQQSEDPVVMVDTLKQVIKSCAQTQIDVDKLAVFDLEYIFSQIRAVSVGEIVELFFYCDTCDDDEKAKVKISIDITKLKVESFPGHTVKIPLFGDVGVSMKYPNINVVKSIEKLGETSTEVDLVFDIITECIDYIYDTSEVYYAKEQTKEELSEFINNLTSEQFEKIENFFETMPKLQQKVSYRCPVCSKEHNKTLEGLNNFF